MPQFIMHVHLAYAACPPAYRVPATTLHELEAPAGADARRRRRSADARPLAPSCVATRATGAMHESRVASTAPRLARGLGAAGLRRICTHACMPAVLLMSTGHRRPALQMPSALGAKGGP